MKKNLNGKIALIVAVLAVFVFGIFGVSWVPWPGQTPKPLMQAMTSRIHLGLDLRGGAHLILQVVVSEAVNAETDNTVGRIEQDLKAANLSFSQAYKPDPVNKPEVIRLEGTTPEKASDVRSALENKYSNEYEVSGGGGHFSIVVVSPVFAGKSTLESQRLVYGAITHLMKGDLAPVHAVDSLKTKVP